MLSVDGTGQAAGCMRMKMHVRGTVAEVRGVLRFVSYAVLYALCCADTDKG